MLPRLAGVTAVAVLAGSALAGSADTRRFETKGIVIEYPADWFVTVAPLSNAVNPAYRFAVGTRPVRRTSRDSGPCLPGIARQLSSSSALAYIREALGADRRITLPQMQPRPRRFRLPTSGDNSLCGFGQGGRWISFKQAGRAFYLGVYVGPRATAETRRALSRLLDGMRIRAR